MKKIRTILKVVCVILTMLLVFTLAGCTSGASSGQAAEGTRTFVFGFSQQRTSEFMDAVLAGCYKAIDDFNAKGGDQAEMKLVNAESDPDKQNNQAETLLSQGIDVLLLNPVDTVSNGVVVEAANKAGIPVVTVNTKTINQEDAAAYSGSDDVEAGRLMMQRFVDVLGEDMRVVIISGQTGHFAQIQRTAGYDEVLAQYPTIEVVGDLGGQWGTEPAQKSIESLVAAGKVFDCVATHSDDQAKGVVNALQEAGYQPGDVLVGGIDAMTFALDFVEEGWMDCTLYQDGLQQGYGAVELALALAQGQAVEDNIVPYIVVTKDNIAEIKEKAAERDALVEEYFR